MSSIRLFIGIPIDPAVVDSLRRLQHDICADSSRVRLRWLTPDEFHLTLRFLGEVPRDKRPSVEQALVEAAQHCSPFSTSLTVPGCFPERGPVRIIWVGLSDEEWKFKQCSECLGSALEHAGFQPEERPFLPHITIARVKEDRSDGELRRGVCAAPLRSAVTTIERFVLFESRLSAVGATYVPLFSVQLSGVW